MTAYNVPRSITISPDVAARKAARKKVIEEAEHTRKANYQRFLRRMAFLQKTLREKNRRLQASNTTAIVNEL